METLKIPKRKRKLRQKKNGPNEEEIQVTSVEDLFSEKKRRLEIQKRDHILEQVIYNNKIKTTYT